MPDLNFNKFNNKDYLSSNPNEKKSFWKILLDYLNKEATDSSINAYPWEFKRKDNVFGKINNYSDLKDDTEDEEGFYSNIYNDMIEALELPLSLPINININDTIFYGWFNRPWNDSVAKLIYDYYFSLDLMGMKEYELNSLYLNADGNINIDRSRGSISIYEKDYQMRVIDICNADAGHSFNTKKEITEFIDYLYEVVLVISYCDKNDNTKDYLNTPLVLSLNKEAVLKDEPVLYTDLFDKDTGNFSSKIEEIIGCLEGTNKYGWRAEDIIDFINTYNPKIEQGEENIAIIQNQIGTGYFYYRGAHEEKKEKLIHVKEDNLWVIPWYNIDGRTYSIIRSADLKMSAIQNGFADDRKAENQGKFFLDFTRKYNSDKNSSKWMRLLMPQYKRKVEVEDLNRNFWVIAQTISAITAFLFDPDGPYPKMIGGLINEIMQIWENVLFMWADIAAELDEHFDTITKVVYISPENYSDYLSYDDFDMVDIVKDNTIMEALIGYGGKLLNLIPILKVNHDFEKNIVKYLKEYRKKFANKNVNLIPVVRLDNYENNYYRRIICPGIYRYFKNYEALNEKTNQADIPPGEMDLEDNVYYSNTILLENNDPVLLNCFKESFMSIISEMRSSAGTYYYSYDISTKGFEKVIAGIYEKADESGYGGINWLVKSEELMTASQEKIYGLIKPLIYAKSYGDVNDSYEGAETVAFNIEAYDLAKYFIETENKIENNHIKIGDGEEGNYPYIVYRKSYSDKNGDMEFNSIDKSRQGSAIITDNSEIKIYNKVDGIFGYYLGELLSLKKETPEIEFNIIKLPSTELQPSWIEQDIYISQYGHATEDYPDIQQDEKNDKITLINLLKNIYDKWKMGESKKEEFWDDRRIELKNHDTGVNWDENQEATVGYGLITVENEQRTSGEKIIKTRENVEYSNNYLPSGEKVWGDAANWSEAWRKDAWDYITDLNNYEEMSESTILFVSGGRTTGWIDHTDSVQKGVKMTALDGLLHHEYATKSPTRALAGAAIRVPIGQGESVYEYYKKHTTPSAASNGWQQHDEVANTSLIWRAENKIDDVLPPNDGTILDDNGIVLKYKGNENLYKDYKNLTLLCKNESQGYFPRFNDTISSAGWGDGQYFILRKEEDSQFNDENWLIEEINRAGTFNPIYYRWYRKNDENEQPGLVDPWFFEQDNIVAKGQTGMLKDLTKINSCLKDYYTHTYQKYINSLISKWNDADKDKQTLNSVLQKEEFQLRYKLFGWIRIIPDNSTPITFTFDYKNPFDYKNSDKNSKDIIDNILRTKETIAGKNYYNSSKRIYTEESGSDLTLNELKTIINLFSNGTVNENLLQRCKYMGSFCQRYDSIEHSSVKDENIYYENRILGYYRGISIITQTDMIYNNQTDNSSHDSDFNTNIRKEYVQTVEQFLNLNTSYWWDSNEINMYRKIAKWIIPWDRDSQPQVNDYKFELIPPNQAGSELKKIELSDKLYFNGYIVTKVEIYVFGPDSEYARRGVYRYPYNVIFDKNNPNNIEKVNVYNTLKNNMGGINAGVFGAWPERPNDLTTNANSWKDDYQITGNDIDNIRQGYVVISSTDKENNFELYKTRGNKKNEESFVNFYEDSQTINARTVIVENKNTDDFDFENIWEYRSD